MPTLIILLLSASASAACEFAMPTGFTVSKNENGVRSYVNKTKTMAASLTCRPADESIEQTINQSKSLGKVQRIDESKFSLDVNSKEVSSRTYFLFVGKEIKQVSFVTSADRIGELENLRGHFLGTPFR